MMELRDAALIVNSAGTVLGFGLIWTGQPAGIIAVVTNLPWLILRAMKKI